MDKHQYLRFGWFVTYFLLSKYVNHIIIGMTHCVLCIFISHLIAQASTISCRNPQLGSAANWKCVWVILSRYEVSRRLLNLCRRREDFNPHCNLSLISNGSQFISGHFIKGNIHLSIYIFIIPWVIHAYFFIHFYSLIHSFFIHFM